MTEPKPPAKVQETSPTEAYSMKPQTFRLRPIIARSGFVLLFAGLVSIAISGVGFFSVLALLVGLSTLLINRLVMGLIQRSQNPLGSLDQLESNRTQRLTELKRFINKTQYLENVGGLGERASLQLSQIGERFDQFQTLLQLKFNPHEITYDRFFSAAEQTFLSVLDHLQAIAVLLNSIDAINPRTLELQLKTTSGSAELKSLVERKALCDQQLHRVNELFSFNEMAITELDRVSTALAETQTRKGESSIGLESAMGQLTELANRAKKYTVSS